jgi:hypothetical protein
VQVLLTIGWDGEPDALEQALVAEARRSVDGGDVSSAVVNVRLGGAAFAEVAAVNNERDAFAMVKLRDPTSTDAALGFTLPDGARLVGGYASDEIDQKPYVRTWPSGIPSPGVKLVCFVRRTPSISHDQYLEHWRERHAPLAIRVQPAFWHYVQNHVSDWLTRDTPDFDGIGEIHCRTPGDLFTKMYADDEARRLIWEDMDRFMVNDRSTVLTARETVVAP